MVREPLQALYCALGVREGYMCVYSGKRSQGRVTPNPPIHKHIHTRHKNVPLTPFPPVWGEGRRRVPCSVECAADNLFYWCYL